MYVFAAQQYIRLRVKCSGSLNGRHNSSLKQFSWNRREYSVRPNDGVLHVV